MRRCAISPAARPVAAPAQPVAATAQPVASQALPATAHAGPSAATPASSQRAPPPKPTPSHQWHSYAEVSSGRGLMEALHGTSHEHAGAGP